MSEAEQIVQWLEEFSKIHEIKSDVWYDITNDISHTYQKMEKIKNVVQDYKIHDQAHISMSDIQMIIEGTK